MKTQRNQERHYLSKNLIRLLKNLKFSDIRVNPQSPVDELERTNFSRNDDSYLPAVVAKKNEVVYYFEFIGNNSSHISKLKNPLQGLYEVVSNKWDSTLILVTHYGNKDEVQETARKFELPYDHIWEF